QLWRRLFWFRLRRPIFRLCFAKLQHHSAITSTAPAHSFFPGYRSPYGGITEGRRTDRRGDFRYRPPYRGYGGYPYYANSWELLPWDLGYPDFAGYGYDNSASDAAQQPAASVAPPDD